MRTVAEALAGGLRLQREGRHAEAEAVYRDVLGRDPENADALHLLGLAAAAAGRRETALASIVGAIRLRPEVAAFHSNLGNILQSMGQAERARLCYEHALGLEPGYAEAHVNLGNALAALGRREEAVSSYAAALRLRPELAEAHNNLGNALAGLGRHAEAAACFGEALRRKPDYAEAYVNLAGALRALGRVEEAAACCREAIRRKPGLAEAYAALGGILLGLERFEEAGAYLREGLRRKPESPEILVTLAVTLTERGLAQEAAECSRRALELAPGFAEAHNNLGTALEEMSRLEEAEACYRRALERRPGFAEAHYNLGNVFRKRLRMREAEACYEAALRRAPGDAKTHWNRALTLLASGDFERGWEEFEWRWKKKPGAWRDLGRPVWDGSAAEGRTLLVWAEQGLGDTIQFVRYAALARERGARVVVECQRELAPLVEAMREVDAVVAPGEAAPGFDAHAPLMSLPRIFGTRFENMPARIPYLAVEAERAERWKSRLAGGGAPKVGLVWAGNPGHASDRRRSMMLDDLAPLARVGGVEFYSLQFGPRACQASAPPPGLRLRDLSREIGDFREMAAAMANLDLLVTVDTSAAHLAGALGRPVWLLLAHVPDWRWMLGRADTPWYPSMRLFRQELAGAWGEVVERVAARLSREFAL